MICESDRLKRGFVLDFLNTYDNLRLIRRHEGVRSFARGGFYSPAFPTNNYVREFS